MNKKSLLHSQSGQMTVEMILLAVVLFSVLQIVSREFQAEEHMKSLVLSPWNNRIAGMIENGAWGTVEATNALHPNRLNRHSSIVGNERL